MADGFYRLCTDPVGPPAADRLYLQLFVKNTILKKISNKHRLRSLFTGQTTALQLSIGYICNYSLKILFKKKISNKHRLRSLFTGQSTVTGNDDTIWFQVSHLIMQTYVRTNTKVAGIRPSNAPTPFRCGLILASTGHQGMCM